MTGLFWTNANPPTHKQHSECLYLASDSVRQDYTRSLTLV